MPNYHLRIYENVQIKYVVYTINPRHRQGCKNDPSTASDYKAEEFCLQIYTYSVLREGLCV